MQRVTAACAVSIAFLAAGCGGDDGGGEAQTTPSAAKSTAQAVPGKQLGGPSNGLVFTIPAKWKQVDPTTDASPVVQTSFGLASDRGALLKELLAKQVEMGFLFAYDTSVTQGYAPNLHAGCDRGGLIGTSQDQLKRKLQAVKPRNLQITDLTVAGKPAFKASYLNEIVTPNIVQDVRTIQVTLSPERFCMLEIDAQEGTMPPEAEQILSSFRPA